MNELPDVLLCPGGRMAYGTTGIGGYKSNRILSLEANHHIQLERLTCGAVSVEHGSVVSKEICCIHYPNEALSLGHPEALNPTAMKLSPYKAASMNLI